VHAPDARFQDIASGLYTELKLRRGFSGAEIVNKARALKGVLQPCSSEGNRDLLARAGFTDVMTMFKYVCFEGFVAIRN
jgi:tRNA (cmo5U34)-methyltransferase